MSMGGRERNGFGEGREATGDPVDLTGREILSVNKRCTFRKCQHDLSGRIFDTQSDPARRRIAAHSNFDRAATDDYVEARGLTGLMGK